jgi:DNA-binding transcriptional ArsR family regulator
VTDICAGFDISQPSVSAHLQILRDAGLVQVEPKGNQRIYSLTPEPLQEIADWLAYFKVFWGQKLDLLGKALENKHPAKKKRTRLTHHA